MNPLVPDPRTGFLGSGNSPVAFGAHKKAALLGLARKEIEENSRVPSLLSLSKAVGISLRTFQRHLQLDEQFRDEFREILMSGESILTDVMFDRGKTPGGYMDRITWLRRHFPENWNPEYKLNVASTNEIHQRVYDAIAIDSDPEILERLSQTEKNPPDTPSPPKV